MMDFHDFRTACMTYRVTRKESLATWICDTSVQMNSVEQKFLKMLVVSCWTQPEGTDKGTLSFLVRDQST